MSCMYCDYCDQMIDTDYEVDHFNDEGECQLMIEDLCEQHKQHDWEDSEYAWLED